MVSVNQIKGRFVSSSAPKPLMLPINTKFSKVNKPGMSIDEISDVYSENYLYSKAKMKNVGTLNRGKVSLEYGDVGCPPVQGREHIPVQTDLYLEELCDLIEENDVDSQTDPLLDRPASPLFIPQSSGTDVETQIYEGDLFDFDREVQPLLECIVGETLEQSLIEIVAEEKLLHLEDQQKEFEICRHAEVAECLRLEEEERRLLEEKQRRLMEQDEAIQLEEDMTKKVAACVFAQNYLSDLLPKMYKRLEKQGYFITQDTEIQEIEENFWPWLIDEVDGEIKTLQTSCNLLDSLIEDAVQNVTQSSVIRPVTPDVYPERKDSKVEIPDQELDESTELTGEDGEIIAESTGEDGEIIAESTGEDGEIIAESTGEDGEIIAESTGDEH